ncbi:MAG: Hsp33 family molecular chaperone HslO [Neisseriales bacterium]|nr:MAG: Hsp33 family molecular chaperone HslO [Neisseriales bacterium]
MSTSFVQKFIFENLPIKGAMVVLEDCWETIASQREYPLGLKQLLGELLAANVLMTSNLKLQGKVICQIQDNPHFRLVVCECSNDMVVRATAKFVAIDEAVISYSEYMQTGRLVVSIDSKNEGNLYQSIIAFNGNLIDEIINNYMAQSEQLKSWFLISYSEHRVVGFMLQQLPDTHHQFAEEIERVFMLANTLTTYELLHTNLQRILYQLFNEDNIVVMPELAVKFGCSCSRQRVSEILRSLGKGELESLIEEQGNITVDCDYCNAEYKFTQQELSEFVLQLSIDEIPLISDKVH